MFPRFSIMILVYVVSVNCKPGAKSDEKVDKPEISEQIDPSIYIRQGMMNGMGMGPQFGMGGQNAMNTVNFAFNCKCTSKSTNPLAVAPLDANALAQQQIVQLQEQVRRQQEIINRQAATKNGFENFTQLIALANSMDCSCSSDNSGMGGQVGMGGIYASQGGMGGGGGFPPITHGFGFPAQRGVPITTFGGTQQMIEVPYARN
ncbi:hypothetical protein CAEBREN_29795 [Caenorhabditis brenneri]|uniref:Uncharacterized protein n=1 Tax=Caenorhabditis brenneri TaxID=135651 RepID=G0PBR6_CAEBE|nr:hypothetical protein CAEBREN_29795 [Caenorhabditis brenneri]